VRLEGRIVDCAVLIAVGVDAAGKRRVLGCTVVTSEAEINWRRFLESLLARGLHGIKLIIADDHAGLKAARKAVLPSVPWQRIQRYVWLYNHHIPQKALGHITPIEAMKKWYTEKPELFIKVPCNRPGPDKLW
jgi:transposase-like protein